MTQLLIWAGGCWRKVWSTNGRCLIGGWRRPAALVGVHKGTVRRVSLAALARAVRGEPVPQLPSKPHKPPGKQKMWRSPRGKRTHLQAVQYEAAAGPSATLATNNHTENCASRSEKTPESVSSLVKEITLTENDYKVLRNYLSHTSIDVDRFDNDERYQQAILYRLQPLVRLEINPRVTEQVQVHFAAKLGLTMCKSQNQQQCTVPGHRLRTRNIVPTSSPTTHIHHTGPQSSGPTHTFSSTPYDHSRSPGPHSNPRSVNLSQASSSIITAPKRIRKEIQPRQFKPTRLSPPRDVIFSAREYSRREDHTIISWLSIVQEREKAVNGNKIWKELADEFQRLTGKERSWQSLRTRYLRYLLPSLGDLALPPDHAQRLRANAACGEMKWRKNRRNSAFTTAPVQSAFGRKARTASPRRAASPPRRDAAPRIAAPPSPARPSVLAAGTQGKRGGLRRLYTEPTRFSNVSAASS